jgi:PTH1 family peptidyl-tRNA hydrolase
MKLVVGLGNPGDEYRRTRHNVGFEVLESLAEKHGARWSRKPDAEIARWNQEAVLVKPQTYMNLSGSAVQQWAHFYKVDVADIFVVVDDVNLEAGRVRIRGGGSAGGHNGLKSVAASLGTQEYARLRLGVGGGSRKELSSHVLGRFTAAEEAVIEAAIETAVAAIEVFVTDGLAVAMNRYNRKPDTGSGKQAAEDENEDN